MNQRKISDDAWGLKEGLREPREQAIPLSSLVGIVEYGCGNLASLENALDTLGVRHQRVGTPEALAACDRLILPGVGHYGHAMTQLRARSLEAPLKAWNRPLLGICLGMQLLFEGSTEAPGISGLGLLSGTFLAFTDPDLKVPHMGWSALDFQGRTTPVYFVHSYRLPRWEGHRADLGFGTYGDPFVACFRSGRLCGFQFHPEKSGREGLELLKEALQWS